MNTIRVHCGVCGATADVPVAAVLLATSDPHGAPDAQPAAVPEFQDAAGGMPVATVSWLCHSCGQLVGMLLADDVADVLVAAGVGLIDADYADPRPPHPEQSTPGPAFTRDDVLELHEQLEAEAWFTEFCADCRP